MKPNHFLTRLRQDIRKMASAKSPDVYLRYKRFARSKVYTLRDHFKAGKMTDDDKKAFNEAIDLYMKAQEAQKHYEEE